MAFANNNFNILPWYTSLAHQDYKKWYAFGDKWPLIVPTKKLVPFQFVISEIDVAKIGSIKLVSLETGAVTDTLVTPVSIENAEKGYTIIMAPPSICNLNITTPEGPHYLTLTIDDVTYYSDVFSYTSDLSECIKITYWNTDTLFYNGGEINFANDFKYELYIRATIGKPAYEFEEELTTRLGYKFLESQISNKLYRFNFLAPEYICDAMRLIRLSDYIHIESALGSYNAISFSYEPTWEEQGNLASVAVEFTTDTIIQKLPSFNRNQRENFYNALLSSTGEPVLFDEDVVAQYYSSYEDAIKGKLVRDLSEADVSEIDSTATTIVDLGSGAAMRVNLLKLFAKFGGGGQSNDWFYYDQEHNAVRTKYNFIIDQALSFGGPGKPGTDSSEGVVALAALQDVELTDLTAGQSLVFNGTKWVNRLVSSGLNTDELDDYLATKKYINQDYVDNALKSYALKATTLAGYGITDALSSTTKYALSDAVGGNAANANKFGNQLPTYYATADGLTGVSNRVKTLEDVIGIDANGDVYIKKNGETARNFYIYGAVSFGGVGTGSGGGAGATTLSALTDVSINNPTDGQSLVFNGTKWVNRIVSSGLDSTALWNLLGSSGSEQIDISHIPDLSSKYLPLSGGTITGDLSLNQYLRINAWSGYGSGSANVWYNGTTQRLLWENVEDMAFGSKLVLHSGNYSSYALPLSGGTIDSTSEEPITINSNQAQVRLLVQQYNTSKSTLGWHSIFGTWMYDHTTGKSLGIRDTDGTPFYYDTTFRTLIHSGNIGSQSVNYASSAGVLKLGQNQNADTSSIGQIFTTSYNEGIPSGGYGYLSGITLASDNNANYKVQLGLDFYGIVFSRWQNGGTWQDWKRLAFITDNVASATKLQTSGGVICATTDGSGNVSFNNEIYLGTNKSIRLANSSNTYQNVLFVQGTTLQVGYDSPTINVGNGKLYINSSGNVLIGTTEDNGNRLQVQGAITLTTALRMTFNNSSTCGLYPDSWISGADESRLWLYNTGKVAIMGEQGTEIHSDLTAYGSISAPKLIINASYGVYPTAQGIVINTTNNANDYGWNPGIGFHIPGVTYATIKLTNDSRFRFFNSSLTGYFGIVTGEIYAYGDTTITGALTFGSDERYKEKLASVSVSLEDIANAPLFNYRWNDRDDKKVHLGTTAQYWNNTNFRNAVCPTKDKSLWTMGYSEIAMGNTIVIARELLPIKREVGKIKKLENRVSKLERILRKHNINFD